MEVSIVGETTPLSHQDQLAVLQGLTRRTGVLHDAQVTQLRFWGFLAAEHISHFTIEYNFGDKTIKFLLTPKPSEPHRPDLQDRLYKLDEACKWLLGDQYRLTVQEGKSVLYRGKKGPLGDKKKATKVKRGKAKKGK